jgi:hypothetical protein
MATKIDFGHQFCGYFLLPTLWPSKFFQLPLYVAIKTFQSPWKEGVSYVFEKPLPGMSNVF